MLTLLDLCSRHVQGIPLEDKQAEQAAEVVIFYLLLKHRVPKVLTLTRELSSRTL